METPISKETFDRLEIKRLAVLTPGEFRDYREAVLLEGPPKIVRTNGRSEANSPLKLIYHFRRKYKMDARFETEITSLGFFRYVISQQ